jgi:hypothetical protein
MTTELPDLNLTADPLDSLTIPELRIGNAKLRGDLVHAITTPTADRWDALAIVGWLHAKRLDPRARLETWTADDVTAERLSWAVRYAPPVPVDGDQDDDAEPRPPVTAAVVEARAKEDPTVPTP